MFQTNDVKDIKTRILCSMFFSSENHAFYEIMWKNTVEPKRSQTKIRRIHIACWITTATNIHSEYVILISFPLQQW